MNSNGILTLAELDKQMKELVALFQKQAALNYKEKAFYDDAVVMKRLRVSTFLRHLLLSFIVIIINIDRETEE